MPTAELIAIGTELLLGEIVDTNTKYLARQLRDYGVDLYRSTTVGDNLQRITTLMKEALSRADIVITTGGLGPTVDDPTREAAAQAFNTHNEFHPELWEQIRQRFLKRAMNISDNNRKQAMIPAGAVVVENPVGTAPSFIIPQNGKVLICLPGVPREMEYLMQASIIPWLKNHFEMSGIIKARVLHIAAVSESKIDEMVADLEAMTNPTVGLLAHPGVVDIRITAKADSEQNANEMIEGLEKIIRQRLGNDIYGVDDETLPLIIQKLTEKGSNPIKVILGGFSPETFKGLEGKNLSIERVEPSRFSQISISDLSLQSPVFSCLYTPTPEHSRIDLNFSYPNISDTMTREYMGAPGLREEWAVNFCLSFIRHQLISKVYQEEKNDPG
ncbi:MAG: competence/damage-inducible protein A [Chloroflexi bacterium HGW-Chloroflexi-4]|jgi:competence/damage-inducible protein CinA-like protein|nr:MAG: competence/damage-inducible protein A [Chloroflexi bacterium HGW-Chloroflexi-4]